MREWHHPQTWADSCVPACMCIVQRWRGQAPTEEQFHRPAPRSGNPAHLALALPGARRLPTYETDEIHLALRTDELVVVCVLSRPYVQWQERCYPGLRSPHGRLCEPGDFGGSLHAVVLTRRCEDGFHLLDPYFAPEGQPLQMSDDDFERCFGGAATAVER